MSKWNVYEIVDGVWDIVETVKSNTEPNAKKGQKIVKSPSQKIDWSTVNPDPRLAFPAAYGGK